MRTIGVVGLVALAAAATLSGLGGVAHADTAHPKKHQSEIMSTQGIVRGSFKAVPRDLALDHVGGVNAGDECTNDSVC
ncbi:hypothetical protein [Mycolicibacterium sp.]|uniref:hypothetical protein n=1 Tax=Mycolicibacterium sp. TaxID=2320850 RepID=UPI00355E6C27